jgi:hypothetical protein
MQSKREMLWTGTWRHDGGTKKTAGVEFVWKSVAVCGPLTSLGERRQRATRRRAGARRKLRRALGRHCGVEASRGLGVSVDVVVSGKAKRVE